MKVYLAGPITGLAYDGAIDWRAKARDELAGLGITCFCPLRGKEYLRSESNIADSYDQHIYSTSHAIAVRDMWDATRCDVMLVNLLGAIKVSIGTVLEIGMAAPQNKPIVVCMEPDNIHQHAMIRDYAYTIHPTLEQGIYTVKRLLLP